MNLIRILIGRRFFKIGFYEVLCINLCWDVGVGIKIEKRKYRYGIFIKGI